jgi:hypothetical protein
MFLSHLNCFIGGIAFLLFLLRFKRHSFSENLLFVFTGLTFLSSALWLYVNYYNSTINQLVDVFGIVIENFLLSICLIYIYFIGKKVNVSKQVQVWIGLFAFAFLLFFIHYKISNGSTLILHPSNKNILNNIVFQVVIDCVLLLLYLFLFFTKKINKEAELFDGNFRRYILFAFSFYFAQDIFILFLFILAVNGVVLPQILMEVTLLFNTITSLFLVMAAIYTNWLKEYNLLRNKERNRFTTLESRLSILHLNQLKKIDWNEIQFHFKETHSELILKIESNKLLSQTEKLYAFLDHFNFSNKELSNILFVSIRTIETNFYRMRRKLKN